MIERCRKWEYRRDPAISVRGALDKVDWCRIADTYDRVTFLESRLWFSTADFAHPSRLTSFPF